MKAKASFEEDSHLKLILGCCPGTKSSKFTGQVKVQASSEEESVLWTSSGERLVSENSFYHRGHDRSEVAMKKVNMKVDLKKKLCEIFSKEMELMKSSSGNYCV